jgi:phosphate starvation-inducible PhoH-like protein
MYPIFDFLSDYLSPKQIEAYLKSEDILTLPLAFQRGMTFRNSFVLLDEAQNTRPEQIRMFLTRIGANCKVVITGDPNQSDIHGVNGLVDAVTRLKGVNNLGIIEFSKEDILRNPIVADIEERYSKDQ